MAFDFTQPIPVTTVADNNYPRPQLNADGQWIVSASAVNQSANKIVLFSPLTLRTTPVTPYTTSIDYYNKVKTYENTLAKIQQQNDLAVQGMVDTTNPNVANSFGDVTTAGKEDWQLGQGAFEAIPKLLKGDYKGAWDAWYDHSTLNMAVDKVKATSEVIYNGIVAPVTAEIKLKQLDDEGDLSLGESLKSIGLKYLNNSLVNLGETMDAITGANAVKGFLQGIPEGLDQSIANVNSSVGDVYGKGRKQFDWNIKSGGGAFIDLVANTLLEVVSDPTTWVTLGTSGAIKAIAKDGLADVVEKSAKEVGVTILQKDVDDLVKATLRTFTYKDTSLVNTLRNIKIDDVLQTAISPELSNAFVNSLVENAKLLPEMKTLNMIKSVRAGSDAVEKAAMKAVGLSSGLGWGFGLLKGVVRGTKAGVYNMPILTATLNKVFKNNSDVANMTLKNMNDVAVKLEKEMKVMKDLLSLPDECTNEVIRRATKSFQETKYQEVNNILNKKQSSTNMYFALNEWASAEGYENIEVLLDRLKTRIDIIPEDLMNMVQEIEYAVNKTIRKSNAGVIREFAKALQPEKVIQPNIVEIRKLLTDYSKIYSIPDVTNNIAEAELKRVHRALVQGAVYIEGEASNWNFDMFDKFGASQYSTLFEFLPVADLNQVDEVIEYAKSVLEDPSSGAFIKQNAQRMLNMVQSEQYFKELYETGMTIDKAENILLTLDEVLKHNAAEIRSGMVKIEDINYLKKILENWLTDPITVHADIAQNANDAWARIHNFYYKEQIISADQLERMYLAFRKEMPIFKRNSRTLAKIADLVEAMPLDHTPIRMTTARMVSKAVDNIPDALVVALKQKGLDESSLSKLILQFSGVDLTKPLYNDSNLMVREARIALQKLDLQLQDLADLNYYIKEGGLSEIAHEWGKTGFTVQLGNDLLSTLDDLLVRISYTNGKELDSRPVGVVLATDFKDNPIVSINGVPQPKRILKGGRVVETNSALVQSVQLVRDEIQGLIDIAYKTTETKVKATADLVTSKLYQVKLSNINAIMQLLNTELVVPIFEDIKASRGLGEFLDALADPEIPNFATKAVQNLQSLSKSIYVARQTFNLIDKSSLPQQWKDGLYDTLAGMVRSNHSVIHDPEDFANTLLNEAKIFIDNKNNNHPLRLHELSSTRDPLEEVETLFKLASDKSFERTGYWRPLFDGLRSNTESDTMNVFYSAGQTAKQGGQIYSFAHALQDGSSLLYINQPVYDSMLKNIDDKTALELFGTTSKEAKEFLQMNLEAYKNNPNVIFYNSNEDFVQAMYTFAKTLKEVAMDASLTPRLVGYNNALDSLGTDKILSDFMYKNRLNTKIMYNGASYKSLLSVETLDASQYIRVAKDGAVVITDYMQQVVTEIVTKVKSYLDQANVGEPFAKASLMPDFSRDITASLREMLAVIDNFMEVKYMDEEHPALLRSLTESQYEVIRTAFSNTQLMAFRQTLTDVLKNMGDTLLSIKQSNQSLGQTLLIRDALKEYLDEPNIMQILMKYLVGNTGVPAYSFKLFNNPKVFNTWFDKTPEDMITLGRQYDVAEHLQSQMGRIRHHHLLMNIAPQDIQAVSDRLKNEFLSMAGRKYSTWTAAVLNLKPSASNQVHNYLVAKQYYDCITRLAKPKQLITLQTVLQEQFKYNPILDYIFDANHTLMLNKPMYSPGVKVLQSTLIDESNMLLQKINEIHTIVNDVKKMETLNDALVIDQSLREKYGYSLASMRTKEQLTLTYGSFINGIKTQLADALEIYTNNAERMLTEEARHFSQLAYTKKIDGILAQLNDIKPKHAQRRVQTILSMSAADYTKFLYKYAQGVQIIDLGAEVFTKADAQMQKILMKFMRTLKEAEALGVRTEMNSETQYLHVYLDKSAVQLTELEKSIDDFVVPNIPMLPVADNGIEHNFRALASQLDEHTQGMYGISMHRTMNKDRYKELLEYLPDSIKNNILDLAYLDNKDLLETYSQTILGDYESGLGKVFTTYSGNLVTNVAAGFNSVYHNLRGKDLYQTLFFNKEYRLSSWIDLVSRYGAVKHKDVLDAVNRQAMVVCAYSHERGVFQVPINTAAQYQKALAEGATLLDYHSYARAVEVMNKSHINSKLLNTLNKNYLTSLKVGQLLSTGWILRNIPDSTIKGWVQAGFDPMYMASLFNKTKQIMSDYQYTYRKLFDYSEGTLSPDRIAKYFSQVSATFEPVDGHVLNQSIFKRLLAFYDSTSSVATPTQLGLYQDTAHKLYLKVKGVDGITEDIVKDAVQVFAENPIYAESKAVLLAKYPEDMAKELLLLKKFAPEKQLEDTWVSKVVDGIYPVKKLMELNTSFEMLIRTHTFLYHSTYTNGTIANARKMVDMSQFNRAYDPKTMKVMETLLPFSSFQLDNFLFWTDTAKAGGYGVLSIVDDVVQGVFNEEEFDLEELSRNMSLQYLFLSGNLVLNYDDGLVLKTNDSLHGVMQLLTDPVNTISGMLNVPMKSLITLFQAINADPEAYAEDSYNNIKPISEYTPGEYTEELLQLIPIVGAAYMRLQNGWTKGKLEFSDLILPLLLPSVFGVAKLDSAGTTYQSRPIGTNWYDRDKEYKKTHRYVFGVSYVPSWMHKDPLTYANTFDRLQAMGFTQDQAAYMMQNGWYMKAPDYTLKHYTPSGQGRYIKKHYARRYYAKRPRISRAYPKYSTLPKKQKKFNMKSSRYQRFNTDRSKVVRGYRARRIYRMQLYSNRYTRTGVSREAMINWRGPNRSSRQLLRDRSRSSRMRQRNIIRQIKPS